MSKIPSIEEQQLSKLSPTTLDDGLLDRLTACAEGTNSELSIEEVDFEVSLRRIRPRNTPSALSTSLLATLSEAPFAVDEKIVLFNGKGRTGAKSPKNNILRFNIAAAAAVALLGSVAALMVPQNQTATPVLVGNGTPPAPYEEVEFPYIPALSNDSFSTASLNTNELGTSDEVVTWSYPMQSHRIMRPTYFDEPSGENNLHTNQTRLQYGIVPVSSD